MLNSSDPESPADAALADLTNTFPDEEAPMPLAMKMAPPVRSEVDPGANTKGEPGPGIEEPTTSETAPPEPDTTLPEATNTEPEFEQIAVPELSSTEPLSPADKEEPENN